MIVWKKSVIIVDMLVLIFPIIVIMGIHGFILKNMFSVQDHSDILQLKVLDQLLWASLSEYLNIYSVAYPTTGSI